jgi:hypothetical protein
MEITYRNIRLVYYRIISILFLFNFTIFVYQIRMIGHGFNIALIYLPKGSNGAHELLPEGSVNLEYWMKYGEFQK